MFKDKYKTQLYFIALLPPEEIRQEVTAIKKYFAEHYNSKAALRSPPHITLYMPFKWPDKKIGKLKKTLKVFADLQDGFEIRLKDFGAFPPRVIYVDVIKTEELAKLQSTLKKCFKKELDIFNADRKDKPYSPHMTVAFRDLRPSNFKEAWPGFREKKLDFSFTADRITLLRHNGKHWEVFEEYLF